MLEYLNLSKSIEILNLNENAITTNGCLSLIRSVANMGYKGQFKCLYLKSQQYALHKRSELLQAYHLGMELNIRMFSNDLTVFDQIQYELSSRKDDEQEEIMKMRKVFEDIVKDDELENSNILTNSYKKSIYL